MGSWHPPEVTVVHRRMSETKKREAGEKGSTGSGNPKGTNSGFHAQYLEYSLFEAKLQARTYCRILEKGVWYIASVSFLFSSPNLGDRQG